MAGPNDDASDKQHEPTQRKLDEARKKGDLPRSTDMNVAAAYAGLLLCAAALGPAAMNGAGNALAALVARSETLSSRMFSGAETAVGGQIMLAVFPPFAPLLLVPAVAVLLSIVGQRALVFAPSKLEPKMNRISPIQGARNKFGRNGLFEFTKSFVKLLIFSAILFHYLWSRLPDILLAVTGTPAQVTAFMLRLAIGFLGIVLAVAATLGAIDFLWQRAEHQRRNRIMPSP